MKPNLKVIPSETEEKKPTDKQTMFELSEGKVQKSGHLKPPHFDYAARDGEKETVKHGTLGNMLLTLWKRNK